jgi:hypothetical protein
MPSVTCPSCGERGRIPAHFIGTRIKCKKCGVAFLVAGAAKPAGSEAGRAQAQASPGPFDDRSGDIQVVGLEDSNWNSASVATVEMELDPHHLNEEGTPLFAATAPETSPSPAPENAVGPPKKYKVLTPRDKFFNGQFSLERLEDALNHYAAEGWVVRGVATPLVAGFSGGEREQLVILLERLNPPEA